MQLPILFVEGTDDVNVVNSLLRRHGIDTKGGLEHLSIQYMGNVQTVLEVMSDAIRAKTMDVPVGFLIDIDVPITDRWNAVRYRVAQTGATPPASCPEAGYLDQIPDYPNRFGVWLMPDCATDEGKLEHLVQTLIPESNPLWEFAKQSVARAIELINEANSRIPRQEDHWSCVRERDLIKAEVHTWLAWQHEPGARLGAAINCRILGHDSPIALRFLRWLRELYGFRQLDYLGN